MAQTFTRDLAITTDTALAALYDKHAGLRADADRSVEYLKHYRVAVEKRGYSSDVEAVTRYEAKLAETVAAIGAVRREMEPLEAVYVEHKWNRAFLVVLTGNGHVHRSMSCSTCYPTTSFVWLPAYSGADEFEIVEDAGERACSICYPNAPVEITSRATRIFSPGEVKAKVLREERAVAKAARDAKRKAKAPTATGEPLTITERIVRSDGEVVSYKETLNTETAAVSKWLHLNSMLSIFSGQGRDFEASSAREAMNTIEEALRDKRGDESLVPIRALLAIKAAKKMKREGY